MTRTYGIYVNEAWDRFIETLDVERDAEERGDVLGLPAQSAR